MGGQNPYIKGDEPELPRQPYQITIVDEEGAEHVLKIDPKDLPYQDHGLPGSILDICMHHGIELDHACGGVCACTTCHVVVKKGYDKLTPAEENEEDLLDKAVGLTPTSRLGCQAVVTDPDAELEIVVPKYTVNIESGTHGR